MVIQQMNNHKAKLQDYAAKTKFNKHRIEIPFLNEEGIIPIGIDIGYSSTKVYSIFGSFMFPSLPIRAQQIPLSQSEKDIMYKDMEGNVWLVGELALKNLDMMRIQAQPRILYSRRRINSEEFLVLLRVGLFLGLIEDDLDDQYKLADYSRLAIQTGLPEIYIRGDREKLRNCFIGKHNYSIKIGDKKWQTVSIDIEEENISVIPISFGTIWSLAANQIGEITDNDLLQKNILIFDIGHLTANTFHLKHCLVGANTTWEDLSMLEIIHFVRNKAMEATNNQAYFLDYYFDRILTSNINNPSSSFGKIYYGINQFYDITYDVFEMTEKIAKRAIRELDVIYNHLLDIDILYLSGGLAKPYYPYFKKHYASYNLPVLLAESKDNKDPAKNFDTVMANVVGLFNCLVFRLKMETILNQHDNK